MIYTYEFYKENNSWYIDYPEFIANGGNKENLLMVRGADTMLEHFSQEGRVKLTFSNSHLPTHQIKLTKLIGDPFGATYRTNRPDICRFVWLCNVTKAIMGNHPKHIYINVLNKEESIN